MHTGIRHNLSLQLVELRIQHLVLDAPSAQHAAQLLRRLDGDSTYQHGLSLRMGFLHCRHDRMQLFPSCLVYCVLMIDSLHRPVGGNLDNVHAVDIAELSLLRQCRTGHTGFLFKQVKEILEGDGCKGLALPLDLHMLLRLDCLMQTIRIAPSRHDTSGELIHDQHLIVLHHIILVTEHQVMRTERQNDIMLDLQILRICKVVDVEEFFHLLHTCCRQVHDLILFIDNKVARLFSFNAHDGIHL